jgi:hypothetical protein
LENGYTAFTTISGKRVPARPSGKSTTTTLAT